ncbi:MAG: hypothetical protein IPM51_06935 [Sphingobacteriaceae bacterium]|nr:hypothetical protein [Sphingobacteriaceae bacterium]
MANVEVEKLEYLNVQLIKAEINNIKDEPLQKGGAFQLEHKVKASHFYNLDKQMARVIIDVDIIVVKEGKRVNAGAKFEIDNYFLYPELEKFAHKKNDKVLIESQFSEVVKGLAYSTTRGIIHSKLAGTFLEGAILPVKMSTEV